MDELTRFRDAFNALTGELPFPWQESLYMEWFSKGKFPSSCNLPTGLGKTSVVAIWLIALANRPEKTPRRLVYVVNRRTVVDQTTEEVLKYRQRIAILKENNLLKRNLGALAISTLRGQFADNREWSGQITGCGCSQAHRTLGVRGGNETEASSPPEAECRLASVDLSRASVAPPFPR